MQKIILNVFVVFAGILLLLRFYTIHEGIAVSILSRPSPDKNTLQNVINKNPNHAFAQEQLAWLSYQNEDYKAVKHYASKALQGNLSSGMSLALLMATFDHDNEAEKAHQAAKLSAHLWPSHDISMQMIANHWLKYGDVYKAMSAWNVSLSQSLHEGNFARTMAMQTIFPLLNKIAQHKDSTLIFQPYHASPPLWWEKFFDYLVKQPNNEVAVDRFYQQARLNNSLSKNNSKLYISSLKKANEWSKAHTVWKNTLSEDDKPFAQLIYNGGFEGKPIDQSRMDRFSWSISSKDKIQSYLDRYSHSGGNYSLRIAFNQWVDDYWGYVRQLLVLSPGRYQLKYNTRANLTAVKGVRWIIYCIKDKASEKKIVELGLGRALSGTYDWKSESIDFTVPDSTSCKAQKLALILAGKYPIEKKVRGDIWFDDFVILRKNN